MARRALFMLAAVLVIGCSRSEEGVTTMGGEGQIKSQIEDQVTEALTSYQAAMKASDTETAVAAYSDDYSDAQGNDKASRRDYFNGLFAMGIFRDAKFDNESLDIVVDGDIATAAPVTYVTAAGTTTYEYKMRKEAGDTWRILSAKQIPTPSSPAAVASTQPSGPSATMESQAGRDLLGDAGRLVDRHAMVWVRRLNAPIEQVWETISTIDGLNQWWLGPPKAFELRPGGAFNHHWNNTIADFKEYEYIDFNENTSDYASTGGMRFELSKVDDNTTMFMFLDTGVRR